MGNGFGGIDGGKSIGYHPGQAQAARPRPSEPPQGVEKGGEDVNTPSTGELLVKEAKSAERLESLKGSERLHCRVNEDTRAVYVCNGYFLVKLDRTEYDALVRPVTQRDAGNYILNADGTTAPDPLDMGKLLADTAREAAHDLTPAPFIVAPSDKRSKATISPYYSESGDFVAGFNSDYAAIIDPSLPRKSKGAICPMVVFSGDEPQAMILPVRMDETKSRVPAAVRAYFTEKPQEADGEKLAQVRKERDDLELLVHQLEGQRDAVERAHGQEITRLQNIIDAKSEQIETLVDRLNAQPETQPAPVEEAPQEQAPADKAAALVEKLAALEGITATIKGAQTAAPVVWLAGETDAHKEKIEAMGGKWSAKRSAWYFKI